MANAKSLLQPDRSIYGKFVLVQIFFYPK